MAETRLRQGTLAETVVVADQPSPEAQRQMMRPNIVGDDVRSVIIPRQTEDQRLLTSSPTAS